MSDTENFPRFCSSFYQDSRSWTDDLPVCKSSGIGLSTNVVYREDGQRQEEHSFEDQSCHFKYDDKTSFYGVFDGHEGVQLAKNSVDIITSEILLGQLDGKNSDEEVKQILKQAFVAVETNYLKAMGDKLAEKARLQMEIPDELTPYEAYQKYPSKVDKLNTINTELSCGTTAVVGLIYLDRLFVANVGDSRALLCKTDSDGVLRVIQLSQDHVISNVDENHRLLHLGIPMRNIKKGLRFGNQEITRCLGNYLVKGGYKEFEELRCAVSEPVIADPEIAGGITLDDSYRFLMLMSSGLYRSLEEATGTRTVNKDIAQMVVEQFRVQSTLTGVAQAVVDRVVRIHHDVYMNRTGSERVAVSKREDITLLIRNFNFPLPHAHSPISAPTTDFKSFTSNHWEGNDVDGLQTSYSTINSCDTTVDSTQTSSRINVPVSNTVKPYVSFSSYYEEIAKAREKGDLPEGIDFF